MTGERGGGCWGGEEEGYARGRSEVAEGGGAEGHLGTKGGGWWWVEERKGRRGSSSSSFIWILLFLFLFCRVFRFDGGFLNKEREGFFLSLLNPGENRCKIKERNLSFPWRSARLSSFSLPSLPSRSGKYTHFHIYHYSSSSSSPLSILNPPSSSLPSVSLGPPLSSSLASSRCFFFCSIFLRTAVAELKIPWVEVPQLKEGKERRKRECQCERERDEGKEREGREREDIRKAFWVLGESFDGTSVKMNHPKQRQRKQTVSSILKAKGRKRERESSTRRRRSLSTAQGNKGTTHAESKKCPHLVTTGSVNSFLQIKQAKGISSSSSSETSSPASRLASIVLACCSSICQPER